MKRAMMVIVVALGLLALNACHDARLTSTDFWYLDDDDCAYKDSTIRMNAGPSWGGNNYVEGRNRFYYPVDDCVYPHDRGAGQIGNLVWFMRDNGTVCQAGPGTGWNAGTNYQLITTWYPQPTWGSCNDEGGTKGYYAFNTVQFNPDGGGPQFYTSSISSPVDHRCDFAC